MAFSLSLCFGNTYALVAGSFLYIGPGRGSDGHSEVFSLPTKSDPQVIKVSCSIPVHPKTDLQDAMGFVMNGFLNLSRAAYKKISLGLDWEDNVYSE